LTCLVSQGVMVEITIALEVRLPSGVNPDLPARELIRGLCP